MNVVIIDDHPVVRKGILSILTNEEGIDEIREASNIKEAINVISRRDMDIAIVDLNLQEEDGFDIIEQAKDMNLKTKFIVMSTFISVYNFKKAEQLGVYGYILKEAFPEDILYAISTVSRGKKYYYPEILKQSSQLNNNKIICQLTPREKDVLREIGKGSSNEEIARNLYISEYTVKKHVSSILSKCHLHNRTQIAFMINNIMK